MYFIVPAIFPWCQSHLCHISLVPSFFVVSARCRAATITLVSPVRCSSAELEEKKSEQLRVLHLSLPGVRGHCQIRSNYHRSGVRQDANWGEECQKESAICPSQYDMMTSSKSPFRLTDIPLCLLEYLEAWAWAGMSNCLFPSSDCQAGGGRLWSRNTTCLKQELELHLQMRQE